MAKAHVITWKSIIEEEWLVEGAANASEAREMFLNGECRRSAVSDFDTGGIRDVRLATGDDIASADLHQSGEPHRRGE